MSDSIHFTPAQRQIFRYNDGREDVSADPLVLRGQLRQAAIQAGTTIDKLIDGANAVDGLKDATEEQIAEAWQKAFQLTRIAMQVFSLKLTEYSKRDFDLASEETGEADMAHALGVLSRFYKYLEKKNQAAA